MAENSSDISVTIDDRPTTTVEDLLQNVGRLCALRRLPEDAAVEFLRAGYRHARVTAQDHAREEADVFSASQILSEWHENSAFLAPNGRPATLSIAAGEFRRLCESASVESDASALLELLLAADAVRQNGDSLAATRRELIVGEGHPEGVTRAIKMSGCFISTLNHNLLRQVSEPRRFERSVASSRLSMRQLPALLAYMSLHGQSFLEDLDSWMSSRESEQTTSTIGVGVYVFAHPNNRS
jgi:hypothetical protein